MDSKGWYGIPGPDSDVVLASRVRLARNLSGYPYPQALSAGQAEEVRDRILRAFAELPEGFEVIHLDRIAPLDRRILLERNIVSQEFSVAPNKAIVVSQDQCVSAMVNEEDHLRLAGIASGMALESVHRRIDELDTLLEDNLHFAASMEWGYLNAGLHNSGTGLRASVMLHLPALVMDGSIGWALKKASQQGLQIKGHWGEGESSLGDVYQVSNPSSLGAAEQELVEGVRENAATLVDYERRVRAEMIEKRRMDLEDSVFRAFGILTNCRLVSSREAIELLSTVRFGVALGILERPALETVTALLILSQKAHIQKMLNALDDEADSKLVDYTRAKLIRRALEDSDV